MGVFEVWQIVYDPEEYEVRREERLFTWHDAAEARLMVQGHIKIFWHDKCPDHIDYEVRPA